MIYKKVLILALSTITATAAANKDNLRGVISLASDGEEKVRLDPQEVIFRMIAFKEGSAIGI